MFKGPVKYFLLLLSLFSNTKIYSEFIILDCSEINNWTDKRDVLYSLQIGTGSKKVIQVFKKNQLQMQLKETASHYEIGQYSDASETELIPLLKVNKKTLVVDYSNKTRESSTVSCRRT